MAPTGVAQLIGFRPAKGRVGFPGWIPHQGTCLGCRLVPSLGSNERQPVDVSLPFFLPFPLSLKNKINKVFKKNVYVLFAPPIFYFFFFFNIYTYMQMRYYVCLAF